MLPVMVNLDGFVLTHTYELVSLAEQGKVDAYIPYQKFENRLDLDAPRGTCITAGPPYNTEFRYQQHQATLKAAEKVNEADAQFGRLFGRSGGTAHREPDAVLPFGQLLRAGAIALLLRHLGQVLDGDLIVHQNLHLACTVQLSNGSFGLDHRQRAGI